jgi:hypothetical protein
MTTHWTCGALAACLPEWYFIAIPLFYISIGFFERIDICLFILADIPQGAIFLWS